MASLEGRAARRVDRMTTSGTLLDRTQAPHEGGAHSMLMRALPRLGLYLALAVIIALIAGPFLWMVSSAFKDQIGILATPPAWIPSPAVTDNFVNAWTQVPF